MNPAVRSDAVGASPIGVVAERVSTNLHRLTPAEARLAESIQEPEEVVALFTARELASRAGVSESTVTRLSRNLGFADFTEMQVAVRNAVLRKLQHRLPERMQATQAGIAGDGLMDRIREQEVANIRWTLSPRNDEPLRQTCAAIVNAQRVFVLGSRSSAAVGMHLAFALSMFRRDVVALDGRVSDYDALVDATAEDVLISIAMARYSRHTIAITGVAAKKGMAIFGITDSLGSPLARFTNRLVLAANDSLSLVPSAAALMAVTHVLLTMVGAVYDSQESMQRRLGAFEAMYQEQGLHSP